MPFMWSRDRIVTPLRGVCLAWVLCGAFVAGCGKSGPKNVLQAREGLEGGTKAFETKPTAGPRPPTATPVADRRRTSGNVVECTEARAKANAETPAAVPTPRPLPAKFASLCASCHGSAGQGQGTAPKIVGHSPTALRDAVRQGRSSAMPAYTLATLSEADLDAIVDALFVPPEETLQSCQFNPGLYGVGQASDGLVSSQPKADLATACLTGTQTFEPGPVPLSYVRLCADCHGSDAKGRGDIPGLMGVGREKLVQVVRAGVAGKMPGFEKELVSEADLHQLTATWSGNPVTADQTESCGSSAATLTPLQIKEQGLAAARKPDAQGFACVSCHSPDLFDMAYLGFDEASIARRGLLHVDGDAVKAVFRYVHQLRKEHALPDRNPLLVRPFQPGGKPLTCANPEECDHAFGKELVARVPSLALPRLGTLAQAESFKSEFLAVNPRTMPIGIALNRWTEDGFRGAEHGRFNEWIPDISYRPHSETDRAALHALHDAYIAQPSWSTLGAIVKAVDTHAAVPEATAQVQEILKNKYKSVLIASHLFRLQSGGQEFGDMPAYLNPFGVGANAHDNPWWAVGDAARVMDNGYDEAVEGKMFAPAQIAKISLPFTPRSEITSLRLTWFWLGFLFDNGVMHSGQSNATKSTEYFTMQLYGLKSYTHVAYVRFQKAFSQAFRAGTSVRTDGKGFLASNASQEWSYMAGYENTWRVDTKSPASWKLPPEGEKRELFLRTQANMVRANALLIAHEARTSGVENKDLLKANLQWGPKWLMKTLHNKTYAVGATDLTGDAAADGALFDDMFAAIDAACEKRPLKYKETTYPNRCP